MCLWESKAQWRGSLQRLNIKLGVTLALSLCLRITLSSLLRLSLSSCFVWRGNKQKCLCELKVLSALCSQVEGCSGFPLPVNQQRACEVAWLNYFTISTHTQSPVSSHTVAKDLSSSGLGVFVKQRWAMAKSTPLLLILEEKCTATHSTHLPPTTQRCIWNGRKAET